MDGVEATTALQFERSGEQGSSPLFHEKDGKLLVSSVRDAISKYFATRQIIVPQPFLNDPRFDTKLGCFVTLKANDVERSLRGCIGFPEPTYKLARALTEASIFSATQDPRFVPLTSEKELASILVEVSVLTPPSLISTKSLKEIPSQVKVGRDGLIMRWSFGSGLLLPQVAIEQGWNAEEFLANLAMKAGAPPDQWLVAGTQIFKFQAQVFSEEEPAGFVKLLEE